jgi:chromosome segregation ATPase
MKAKSIYIFSILLFFLVFSPVNVFAQVFGASEKELDKIYKGVKRVHARLETLKNTHIEVLRSQQEDLLRQFEELKYEIEGIKQAVPQLQGAIEQSTSNTLDHIEKTNIKISDVGAEVKNHVLDGIEQQKLKLENFSTEQKNMKEALAQDIEKIEQSSRANFQKFLKDNNRTLSKVIQQLEVQSSATNKGFDDTIALFQTEVIPTMAQEIEKNRQLVIKHLGRTNENTLKTLEAFFAKNKKVNDGLREILKKSLKQGMDTRSLLDSIKKDQGVTQASLVGANQVISGNRSTLVELQKSVALISQNMLVADKKNNKLATSLQTLTKGQGVTQASLVGAKQDITGNRSTLVELQKSVALMSQNMLVADKKNNKLATSLQTLHSQYTDSNEVLASLGAGLEHAGESNKVAVEKLDKLIDLSREFAIHSSELESSLVRQLKESVQVDDARNSKVDLANEKLSRLIGILKVIAKGQEQLGPIPTFLGNMQKEQAALQKTQTGIKKNQEEIKKALADLRRKANVNISDIRKILRKLSSAKKRTLKK